MTLENESQKNKLLKEEEELKKDSLIDLPPPPLREPNFLTLLEKSDILFGQPGVIPRGLNETKTEIVLGWMAQAYVERHSLDKPAGLVYRRLQAGYIPKEKYLENPENYLPKDYLNAIGLLEEPEESEIIEMVPIKSNADESIDIIPEGSRYSPAHAFECVWQDFERTMSRGTYLHWLSACLPINYMDGVLTIGTIDMETQAWLTERVLRTAERGLSGYFGKKITVKFIVME